jgi:hypothetical protein
MAQTGRPTIRTPEMIDEIIERIAKGESLRKICEDEHMPHRLTVDRWLIEDAAFATIYTRAREAQADLILDGMEKIENDALSGAVEAAAASAVLNNQRWRAKVLAPKRYSDRQIIQGDAESPVVHSVSLSGLDADTLRAIRDAARKLADQQP